MSKQKKTHKIDLRRGLRAKDLISVIKQLKNTTVYFLVARDFNMITEIKLLKKLKKLSKKYDISLIFITQKSYFKDILKQQSMTVMKALPDEAEDLETESVTDILGIIVAQKNKKIPTNFASKKIKFRTKVSKNTPHFESKKIENLKDEKSIRSFIFFLFLLIIIGIAGIFFWIVPHAVITIKPKISVIPITQNILVKLPDAVVGEANEKLPSVDGIFVKNVVEDEETFPSTQEKYELTNAKGKITLFNETSEPKFFIPSRLSTADGVIFRTQENYTVPPKKGKIPGKLVVSVIADDFDTKGRPIGNRGNIEAGTDLFFPALRTETRELYYAKANRGPMVGGSTLTRYFIGPEDYKLAKPILLESFTVRGTEMLDEELKRRSNREGKRYVLLGQQGLLKSDLLTYKVDESLIGKESQTFSVSAKVAVSGIVFDQDAIIKVLQKKIEASQDNRRKLLFMDQTSIEYRVLDQAFLEDERWIKLSVSLKGIEALNLKAKNDFVNTWQAKLKKEIAGKVEVEAKSILVNHPEIDEVLKVKISPFWNDNIPSIFEQIEFKIQEEI